MRWIEEGLLGVVIGELQAPLPKRRNQHLGDAAEGAALGSHLHVRPGTQEEEGAGEGHEDGGDGEADAPADVALDVDDEGGGDHHGEVEGEVVDVEEAVDALPPVLGAGVELVGAEGQVAWPDAAGSDDEEGEAEEQEGLLPGCRATAESAGVTLRRMQLGDGSSEHDDEQSLHAANR